jgi:hypothetical protein
MSRVIDKTKDGHEFINPLVVLEQFVPDIAREFLLHQKGRQDLFHEEWQRTWIGFRTDHELVEMPDWLREQYPRVITIVLQNVYEDLEVDDEFFGVKLRFEGVWADITVPFSSIFAFHETLTGFRLMVMDTFNDETITNEEILAGMNEDNIIKFPDGKEN